MITYTYRVYKKETEQIRNRSLEENMRGKQSFQFRSIEKHEVETVLKNLNPRKSTGWDGISPLVFLLGANQLASI